MTTRVQKCYIEEDFSLDNDVVGVACTAAIGTTFATVRHYVVGVVVVGPRLHF